MTFALTTSFVRSQMVAYCWCLVTGGGKGSTWKAACFQWKVSSFVTLTGPAGQPPHVVVRAPVWDVHVTGSVSPDMPQAVARSLVQVSVTDH